MKVPFRGLRRWLRQCKHDWIRLKIRDERVRRFETNRTEIMSLSKNANALTKTALEELEKQSPDMHKVRRAEQTLKTIIDSGKHNLELIRKMVRTAKKGGVPLPENYAEEIEPEYWREVTELTKTHLSLDQIKKRSRKEILSD